MIHYIALDQIARDRIAAHHRTADRHRLATIHRRAILDSTTRSSSHGKARESGQDDPVGV